MTGSHILVGPRQSRPTQYDKGTWQFACHDAAAFWVSSCYTNLSRNHPNCRSQGSCRATSYTDAYAPTYKDSLPKHIKDQLKDLYKLESRAKRLVSLSEGDITACSKEAYEIAIAVIDAIVDFHCCKGDEVKSIQTRFHLKLQRDFTSSHAVTKDHIAKCIPCHAIHFDYKFYFPHLSKADAMTIADPKTQIV